MEHISRKKKKKHIDNTLLTPFFGSSQAKDATLRPRIKTGAHLKQQPSCTLKMCPYPPCSSTTAARRIPTHSESLIIYFCWLTPPQESMTIEVAPGPSNSKVTPQLYHLLKKCISLKNRPYKILSI